MQDNFFHYLSEFLYLTNKTNEFWVQHKDSWELEENENNTDGDKVHHVEKGGEGGKFSPWEVNRSGEPPRCLAAAGPDWPQDH